MAQKSLFTPDSLQGVLGIDLLPPIDRPDMLRGFNQRLAECESLRASIAYCTILRGVDPTVLAKALSLNGGFLCVDLHLPTDVVWLAYLVRGGAQVSLHLRRVFGASFEASPLGWTMPAHLLHTKLMLFDLPDGNAELWIGSHNWTQRALTGPNIEASAVIRLKKGCPLYREAAELLANIRTYCTALDPDLVAYYRLLQGMVEEENQAYAIRVISGDTRELTDHPFTLFGTELADLRKVGAFEREVYLQVFSRWTHEHVIYPATVLASGAMGNANRRAGGLTFASRNFAFRQGRTLPRVLMEEPGREVYESANYFVNFDVRAPQPSIMDLEDLDQRDLWQSSKEDPLLMRVPEPYRRADRGEQGRARVPKIQVPTPPERVREERERARRDFNREQDLIARVLVVRSKTGDERP